MTERYYRSWCAGRLTAFEVSYFESDLLIRARTNLSERALRILRRVHEQVRMYAASHPEFQAALKPLPLDLKAPPVVRTMMRCGEKAQVGPMAAVAGAIADAVGRSLLRFSPEVIVENGGDLFVAVRHTCRIGLFVGPAQVFNRLAIRLRPSQTPCGVCTSSASLGHSLSFGSALATVVTARTAALADALATAFGNMVCSEDDVPRVLEKAARMPEVNGIVIATQGQIAGCGDIAWEILDK